MQPNCFGVNILEILLVHRYVDPTRCGSEIL